MKVNYNPYWHGATSPLNDQFSAANKRPNLVVVEIAVPRRVYDSVYDNKKNPTTDASTEGNYTAYGANLPEGLHPWHSGTVSGQLPTTRHLLLTRYDKPMRVLTNEEVGGLIADQLQGTDIAVPYNLVTPQVRQALEDNVVKIYTEKSVSTN